MPSSSLITRLAGAGLILAAAAASFAQTDTSPTAMPRAIDRPLSFRAGALMHVEMLPPQTATLYATGEQVELTQNHTIWHAMCGSNELTMTPEMLADIATAHEQDVANSQANGTMTIVDNTDYRLRGTGGINIVYQLSGSVPAQAVQSFAIAEQYIESVFGDPITVTVSVSFANMGGGVLGATGSNYVGAQSWSTVRAGMISGMDADDTIQNFLPVGNTIPVRYNGSSSNVTDENRVFFTQANFNATLGTTGGTSGNMTYNTQFSWDYDPSNGVFGTSLVDVVVHETGHALGFVSGEDFRTGDIEALDMFRFQRTDGGNDYNPDTTAEFQTTPRLVSFNNPNDDRNSDLISVEYRMSDGNPYQASHFREQNPIIGIMDPALASGQTFYPNYFRQSDIDMFDAVGYDYPPCNRASFLTTPQDLFTCLGTQAVFTASADAGGAPLAYQWQKDGNDISDDGRIVGTTTSTLVINNFNTSDIADYRVVVTTISDGCEAISPSARLRSLATPTVSQQPAASQTLCEGGVAFFQVAIAEDPFQGFDYQWRKGTTPLTDGARFTGSSTNQLAILGVLPSDSASDYNCVIVNPDTGCVSTTNNAALTVASAPSISTQPQGDSVCAGDTIQLTVGSSGGTAFQWRKGGAPLNNGGDISGATSATLSIANAEASDAGNYDVVISNGAGCNTTSSVAAVSVEPCQQNPVGDVDGNCEVGLGDLGVLLANWQISNATPEQGDLTGDGTVNLSDLGVLFANWGATCP